METSLDPHFNEDIKISESTPVSQFSSFSLQTTFMLLIVTGAIHLLLIFFLIVSSTFHIIINIGLTGFNLLEKFFRNYPHIH